MRRAFILFLLSVAQASWAQDVEPDSMLTHEMGEVFIDDGSDPAEAALQKIPLATWRRSNAVSVAEAGRLISSAHIRTNSRGETLITLRGSSDRQVPVYLDGVPLTMPWDQRIDLSLLPAGVLGGAEVSKGALTSRVAANGYGGVVNLLSRSRSSSGRTLETDFQTGSGGQLSGSATFLERRGNWSYLGAIGRSSSDGAILPMDVALPFSQPDSSLRQNTDYSLQNYFFRGAYAPSEQTSVAATFVGISGEKGVAPEGNVDPAVEPVRFWRYPEWSMEMVHLAAKTQASGISLNTALWAGWASQQILQFEDASYETSTGREDGSDNSFGARVGVSSAIPVGTIRLTGTYQYAGHDQALFEGGEGGLSASSMSSFSESKGSLGLEADLGFLHNTRFVMSAGGDLLQGHEAGGNDVPDALSQGFGTIAIRREVGSVSLIASAGRRARFPSMRERYDDALGRFEINSDLGPETAWLFDVGSVIEGAFSALEITAFARRERGTIQTQRDADGTRSRVNLGGSSVYGVEVAGGFRPFRQLQVEGHLTALHARGFDDDVEGLRLEETPGVIGWLSAVLRPIPEFTSSVEATYTGVAYSPIGDGLAKLDPSLVLNLRASYHLNLPIGGYSVEVFGRVNNLTDAVVLPQIGLPGPGRTWLFGLSALLS